MKKFNYFFISILFMFTSTYAISSQIESDSNEYIEEYKSSNLKIATIKELCEYVRKKSSDWMGVQYYQDSNTCYIANMVDNEKDKERYDALIDYVLKHADEIKKERQVKLDLEKNKDDEKQKIKFAEFDKIKNEGRVYATLVMDSTENYNKDSLNTLKNNNNKVAGLKLSYEKNKSNYIEKIILKSPTQTQLDAYLSLLAGQNTEKAWTLDKIKMYLKNIEEKYKKVDEKKDIKKLDLDLVHNAILKYHNSREKPSQADYNIDYNNAQSIKNLEEIYIFENKGDQIIVTIKTCLEGMQNTNIELLYNDIYQNSITIEYISKTLIEKEHEKLNEKLKKDNELKQEEKKEINKL